MLMTKVHVEEGKNGELLILPKGYLTKQEEDEANNNAFRVTLFNKSNGMPILTADNEELYDHDPEEDTFCIYDCSILVYTIIGGHHCTIRLDKIDGVEQKDNNRGRYES